MHDVISMNSAAVAAAGFGRDGSHCSNLKRQENPQFIRAREGASKEAAEGQTRAPLIHSGKWVAREILSRETGHCQTSPPKDDLMRRCILDHSKIVFPQFNKDLLASLQPCRPSNEHAQPQHAFISKITRSLASS